MNCVGRDFCTIGIKFNCMGKEGDNCEKEIQRLQEMRLDGCKYNLEYDCLSEDGTELNCLLEMKSRREVVMKCPYFVNQYVFDLMETLSIWEDEDSDPYYFVELADACINDDEWNGRE